MSALVKNLRLLQAWYLPAGPEPEEAMPSKYRAFKEAADTIESLSAQVAAEHARAERAEAEVAKLKVHAEESHKLLHRAMAYLPTDCSLFDSISAEVKDYRRDYPRSEP